MNDKDLSQYLSLEQRVRNLFGENYDLENCIEELRQYRSIGTPEECRCTVEKQTAQTPNFEGDGYSDGQIVYDIWICPGCGEHYEVDYDKYEYCPICGQKISWDNQEKETC